MAVRASSSSSRVTALPSNRRATSPKAGLRRQRELGMCVELQPEERRARAGHADDERRRSEGGRCGSRPSSHEPDDQQDDQRDPKADSRDAERSPVAPPRSPGSRGRPSDDPQAACRSNRRRRPNSSCRDSTPGVVAHAFRPGRQKVRNRQGGIQTDGESERQGHEVDPVPQRGVRQREGARDRARGSHRHDDAAAVQEASP